MSRTGYDVLIDGYNVIKQHPAWDRLKLADARARVAAHASQAPWPFDVARVILVFDGPDTSSFPSGGRVTIQFASPSADAFIQRRIRSHSAPRRLVLVSDDGELIQTARVHASRRESCRWLLELGRSPKQGRGRGVPEEPQDKPGPSTLPAQAITDELRRRWLGD
ncbi:MAG TPA: NYN domain-containing protein [bacterium]